MKTLYILLSTLFINCLAINFTHAQIKKEVSKLEGTWEYIKPKNAMNIPFSTILRTYDKEGNYFEVFTSSAGTYIQSKATYEINDDGSGKGPLNYSVKEVIKYSVNESRLGKTLNFRCGLVFDNGQTFLLTEGGKKNEDGEEIIEWQEMWRKVVEPKMPLNTSPEKI